MASLVQSTHTNRWPSFNSISPTFSSATTLGNTLVAAIGGAGGAFPTYTPPAGWSVLGIALVSVMPLTFFIYPMNPGGITSQVFTASSSQEMEAYMFEFNGLWTGDKTWAVDVSNNASLNVATTSVGEDSPTTTFANDLVFYLAAMSGNPVITQDASYTTTGNSGTDSGQLRWAWGIKTVSATGIQTFTDTLNIAETFSEGIFCFRIRGTTTNQSEAVTGTGTPSLAHAISIPLKVVGSAVAKSLKSVHKNFKVVGSKTVSLAGGIPVLLAVVGSGLVHLTTLPLIILSLLVTRAGSASFHAVRSVVLTAQGSGSSNLTKVLNKVLKIVATPLVKIYRTRFRTLATTGGGVVKVTKTRIRNLFVTGTQVLSLSWIDIPVIFKNLVVSGTGLAHLTKARCKKLLVTSTQSISLVHIRSVIFAIVGSAKISQLVTVFKVLKVVGKGVANLLPSILLRLAVVGTGVVSFLRTRLRNLAVTGTSAVSMTRAWAVFLTVVGSATPTLATLRSLKLLLKALNTKSKIGVKKSITKGIKVTGGGAVLIKAPRLLKMKLSVTGSKLLALITRKGSPSNAHATKYNIQVTDETQFTITEGP